LGQVYILYSSCYWARLVQACCGLEAHFSSAKYISIFSQVLTQIEPIIHDPNFMTQIYEYAQNLWPKFYLFYASFKQVCACSQLCSSTPEKKGKTRSSNRRDLYQSGPVSVKMFGKKIQSPLSTGMKVISKISFRSINN